MFTVFAQTEAWITTADPIYRDKELHRHPLTLYAVSKWADHSRKTEDKLVVDTVLNFLTRSNNVSKAVQLHAELEHGHRLTKHFSDIHVAALYGLRHVMQVLLEKGIPADSRDSHGRTPLFLAAMTGELGVLNLLLARGNVNVNAQTDAPYSLTPLIVAVEANHHSVIEALLQAGADRSLRSSHGLVPTCELISNLLEAEADPYSRDEKDVPVNFRAARPKSPFREHFEEVTVR